MVRSTLVTMKQGEIAAVVGRGMSDSPFTNAVRNDDFRRTWQKRPSSALQDERPECEILGEKRGQMQSAHAPTDVAKGKRAPAKACATQSRKRDSGSRVGRGKQRPNEGKSPPSQKALRIDWIRTKAPFGSRVCFGLEDRSTR